MRLFCPMGGRRSPRSVILQQPMAGRHLISPVPSHHGLSPTPQRMFRIATTGWAQRVVDLGDVPRRPVASPKQRTCLVGKETVTICNFVSPLSRVHRLGPGRRAQPHLPSTRHSPQGAARLPEPVWGALSNHKVCGSTGGSTGRAPARRRTRGRDHAQVHYPSTRHLLSRMHTPPPGRATTHTSVTRAAIASTGHIRPVSAVKRLPG